MKLLQFLVIVLIRLYRWVISPMKVLVFGPLGRCRFTPSCSEYALEAVGRHGAGRGSWLAARRICRCHPWGGCGHDPVPQPKPKTPVPHSAFLTPHSAFRIRKSEAFARPGLRLSLAATVPMVKGGDRR